MAVDPQRLFSEHHQSLWLDGLRRALVASGELTRLVELGIRGVVGATEHLDAALAGAGDYDDDLRRLVSESRGVQEILEELVVADARGAADALRPVYDDSAETDGWVAVDLPMAPADDVSQLVAEGIRLFRAIGRDNVLLRVPATPEGAEALSELIERGIPTGAHLIFGPAQHQRIAAAYRAGLERRAGRGDALAGVASLACIEVGAVDAAVARRLRERSQQAPGSESDLAAGSGVSLARRVLADRREHAAALSGAKPQRIAWSSTSATDARAQDTRWMDALVAADTISIVSQHTLNAFRDHGSLDTPLDVSDADVGLTRLTQLGIDLDALAEELLDQAVAARAAATQRLSRMIEARREALLEQAPERQRLSLGSESQAVVAALDALAERKAAERLWTSAAELFGRNVEAAAIKSRLGWLRVPQMMRAHTADLESFARTSYRAGFRKALVLGMGGSSLAAQVIADTFGATPGFLELRTLDSTHPDAVRGAEAWADPETTLFVVASKSGTTLEALAFEAYFFSRARERFGDRAGQRFVAITDPETPLADRARENAYLRTFLNPTDVGGRYSALSFFGLLPAALAGADVRALVEDAQRMAAGCAPFVPPEDNPGVRLGAFVGALAAAGRDKLTLLASPRAAPLAAWVEQLLAESTGKLGRGVIPVCGEPVGGPDAYGKDRAFAYLRFGPRQSTDLDKDVEALIGAGFPVARIGMLAEHDLGGEFFRWAVATAIAASVLEVNPFDEPNVIESKQITAQLLTDAAPASDSVAPGDPKIANLVRRTEPGDYVALSSFFAPSVERDRVFSGVRAALRDRLGIATTHGWGPRYLHSTGQLHKGGPPSGVFLILTADAEELPIPGERYGFGALCRAQALGDALALRRRSRRVIHVHLGADVDAGLTALSRQLAAL